MISPTIRKHIKPASTVSRTGSTEDRKIAQPAQTRVGLLIANAGPGNVYLYYGNPSQPVNEQHFSQMIPAGGELDYTDKGLLCPPDEIYAGFDDTNCTVMVTQWTIPRDVFERLVQKQEPGQGQGPAQRRGARQKGEVADCRTVGA